jgi:hypothetical protein
MINSPACTNTDPEKLSAAIQIWHEFHIRWASPKPYTSTPPFTSRVSPGLHIFFTPSDSTSEDELCRQLHDVVGSEVKCSSTSETSIKLPTLSERFSMSAALQYYSFLPSVQDIISRLSDQLCGGSDRVCKILSHDLSTSSYIDIDYNTIDRTVIVNAGWPSAPDENGWTETISRKADGMDGTTEIGVLTQEPNPDPEDIQFGGFLTVLGLKSEPSKPSPIPILLLHNP